MVLHLGGRSQIQGLLGVHSKILFFKNAYHKSQSNPLKLYNKELYFISKERKEIKTESLKIAN